MRRKVKVVVTMLLMSVLVLSSTLLVSAKETVTNPSEPLANLERITDEAVITQISQTHSKVKKALEQNEVLAELEIITDEAEIQKIIQDNPRLGSLMNQKEYTYLARVKGNGVNLRKEPNTSAVINGKLYETNNDWVLLNDNYSLGEGYIWWEVIDSSIGFPGWIVNDYIYLMENFNVTNGRAVVSTPEIDFETLKFVR